MSKYQIELTLGRKVTASFYQWFLKLEEGAVVPGRCYTKDWLECLLWDWCGHTV